MPLPELNDDARREALNKAAEARKLRAEMKQRLKAGEIDLNSVLNRAADDEVIAKTRVSEVLEALPKVGRVRARRLMERLDICRLVACVAWDPTSGSVCSPSSTTVDRPVGRAQRPRRRRKGHGDRRPAGPASGMARHGISDHPAPQTR